MPTYGGHNPFPQRYGGVPNNVPPIEQIRLDIVEQLGTAYTEDLATAVGIETMAEARSIYFDGFGAAQRLTNNFIPATMTAAGLMPRWERIFQLTPAPGTPEAPRRLGVGAAWAAIGQNGSEQPIIDAISTALGPYFVAYETIAPTVANVSWPGGTLNPSAPWMSTVAHVLVRVQLIGGALNGAFYAAVGQLFTILDRVLPAWSTWDWYVASSHGGRGFYLDEPNLDLEVFDV